MKILIKIKESIKKIIDSFSLSLDIYDIIRLIIIFSLMIIFFDIYSSIFLSFILLNLFSSNKYNKRKPIGTYILISLILLILNYNSNNDYIIIMFFFSYIYILTFIYKTVREAILKIKYKYLEDSILKLSLDIFYLILLFIHITFYPSLFLDYYLYLVDHFYILVNSNLPINYF